MVEKSNDGKPSLEQRLNRIQAVVSGYRFVVFALPVVAGGLLYFEGASQSIVALFTLVLFASLAGSYFWIQSALAKTMQRLRENPHALDNVKVMINGESVPLADAAVRSRVRAKASLFSTVTMVLAVVTWLVAELFYCPLQEIEAWAYAALVTLPLALLIVYVFKDKFYAQQTPDVSASQKASAIFVGGLFFAGFLASLFILVNGALDHSPAESVKLTIANRTWRTHKGSTTYFAKVPVTSPPPLGLKLYQFDEIIISHGDYDRITPGRTQIEFAKHRGSLGLPWIARQDYHLSDPPPAELSFQRAEELKDACLWTRNFEFTREIENLSAESYRRDFWSGQQPRSVEPIVAGQIHGLAHYTFANGQTYADIPWKHGKKHGVFTLYREDGSKEETLSYKDGHLYGLNRWFDPNGKTTNSIVYLDDATSFSDSACGDLK